MRIAIILTLAVALAYLVVAAAMYAYQRQLMYFPSTANRSPESVGLDGVSVEALKTADGETLVLWYAPAPEDAPTVLFLHGNGGEISDRPRRFRSYQDAGFGVAFLSWRGYGGSSGTPSEAGFRQDAQAAFDFLQKAGVRPAQIAVVGESLGTGIAVQLAAQEPVGALVLGAPYSATVDVAAEQYPWLPVRWLMTDQFRSIDHIADVSAPILFQHAPDDRVVPYKFGRRLHGAVTAPATFIDLPGGGHDALYEPQTYQNEVDFIRSVFGT